MTQWICSQIGAREHYAVPRALQSIDCLEHLYSDLPRGGIEQIARNIRSTFWLKGVGEWLKYRRSPSYENFIDNGKWFSQELIKRINQRDLEGKVFFGYDTGFLEAAKLAKSKGAVCVLGQMDPGRVEFEIVAEERNRWAGWEDHCSSVPEAYVDRREQEWAIADTIVVNSSWSKHALMKQGVPEEKLSIVPLSYQPPTAFAASREKQVGDKLVVLWLGQVNLRKGIPYLIEAARELQGEPVCFKVAGPVSIADDQVASAPDNIEWLGKVGRSAISDIYAQADLFVLPTLSDGFAITQLEAMAHGLPVIATPNCGQVVEDGNNGYVIPIRDASVLAERIMQLSRDPDKLAEFSSHALTTSKEFTLGRLAKDLSKLRL